MAGTRPTFLTFEEFYSEPTNNPFGTTGLDVVAGVNNVNAGWRLANRPPSIKEVHLNMLADFSTPIGAVGIFVQGGGSVTGEFQVLHGIQNFPGLPGRPSADRRQTFAYLGEVVGIDAVTVAFDDECLNVTASVIVPGTHDRVMQLLNDDSTTELLGPFLATEANTRTIKTRCAIYVPFDLVPIVIGQDLSARMVYELLVPLIVSNGLATTLKPLVDYLTIALVSPTATEATPVTVRDKVGLDWNITPALVGYRRDKVLFEILSDLRPATPSRGDPYVQDLATGVASFVTEMKDARIAGDDRRVEAARPKTFREKYGDRLADQMLLLTNTRDDDLLPNFYHELAGRPKGVSERILLQREVDLAARALGVQPFKVTPSQILALKTFDFVGDGYSEIGTGLLPFSITPPDATSAATRRMLAEDRARAETFDMSGEAANGALTTSDATRLRNNKGYVVADWMEARQQARSYGALVGALLGVGHHCVLNYQNYLSRLDELESRLRWEFDSAHGKRLGPPLMVFHVQLNWRAWFVKQLSTGETKVIPAPDFCHGIDAFDMHNNLSWVPSVANIPVLHALIVPTHGASTRGTAMRSNASPATPVTTPSAPPLVARREPGRAVRNTRRDARFTGNTPFAANVRGRRVLQAIVLAGPPPQHVRGGVTECACVSYHAKGICYDNCDRAIDHVPMSDAEATEFHDWCAIAFA
jgi:hypothetical protein